MPFYNIENVTQRKGQGSNVNHVVIGELMKGGWVITQGKKDPSPHFHPNEEQYMLILEGKIKMVLGDEMKILESGDLIHIPRNTPHCAMTLSDSAKFFAVKSPSGNGKLDQDFVLAENHEEMLSRMADS
jgi:quercetin dioxygenase-like cupin family protein